MEKAKKTTKTMVEFIIPVMIGETIYERNKKYELTEELKPFSSDYKIVKKGGKK